jgi:hypothetical protein
MAATIPPAATASQVRAKAARTGLALLGFGYLLLSAYVEPPMDIGGGRILPAFTTIVILPIALLLLSPVIFRRDVVMLSSVAALLLLSALLSPGREWIGHKLLGLAQTLTAMSAGLALFKLAELLPLILLRRVLLAAWFAVLIGAGLEVSGVLRPAVAAFGQAVYHVGGYQFYSNDVRDLSLLGFPRPKVFTSEPSLVAIAFYLFVTGWLALKPTPHRLTIAFTATGVMLAFVGSPVLLITLAVLSIVFMALGIRRASAALPGLALLVALVLALPFVLPDVIALLRDRVQLAVDNARSYTISSENLRIIFPAIATVDVLSASPILGVGIDGKAVIDQFSSLPIADFAGGTQFGNNFAFFLSYLGLGGAAAFTWIMARWLRASGVLYRLLAATVIVGLSQTMGGFETPRFWAWVFLVFAVYRGASRSSIPSTGRLPMETLLTGTR